MNTFLKVLAAVLLPIAAAFVFTLLALLSVLGVVVLPVGVILNRAADALARRLRIRRLAGLAQ